MQSANKASTQKIVPKSSSAARWLLIVLVSGVVLGLMLLIYSSFSSVSGTEFDPVTWKVRTFSYHRDPFSHRQLTGIRHGPDRVLFAKINIAANPSAATAAAAATPVTAKDTDTPFTDSFAPRQQTIQPRWDLVRIRLGMSQSTGPAFILTTLLESPEASQFWITWSNQNPAKAKALWQAVRDLVSLGLYTPLPTMMETAASEIEKDEFARWLNRHVHQAISDGLEKQPSMDDKAVEIARQLLDVYAD